MGHAEWFAGDDGGRLLDVVAHAVGAERGRSTASGLRQRASGLRQRRGCAAPA